jgi:hypothetical protein
MTTVIETVVVSQQEAVDAGFFAGRKDLAGPEVRRNYAARFNAGDTIESLRVLLRERVVAAMASEGQSTSAESVDKVFNTNGYQRPLVLGYAISLGISPEIAASLTNLDYKVIEAELSTPIIEAESNLIYLSSVAAETADTKRQAREAAKVAVENTGNTFKDSLVARFATGSKDLSTTEYAVLVQVKALLGQFNL